MELPEHGLDRSRLGEVLAERQANGREFFDRIAEEWDEIGERFRSGQARQRAAASLLSSDLTVADLGCGTGYFAEALMGLVGRLILVDASQGMLDRAVARLGPRSSATSIDARMGELDALPIADAELDGVVAGMVLHHLPSLELPLREMKRVLKPGGRAVVLDLAPHRESWMHAALGDRHLGLDPAAVAEAFTRAGFEDVRLESPDDRYCPSPPVADESPVSTPASPPVQAVALPLYVVRGRVPSRTRRATDEPKP
jgi:ArsR family transcriptional regulator